MLSKDTEKAIHNRGTPAEKSKLRADVHIYQIGQNYASRMLGSSVMRTIYASESLPLPEGIAKYIHMGNLARLMPYIAPFLVRLL